MARKRRKRRRSNPTYTTKKGAKRHKGIEESKGKKCRVYRTSDGWTVGKR